MRVEREPVLQSGDLSDGVDKSTGPLPAIVAAAATASTSSAGCERIHSVMVTTGMKTVVMMIGVEEEEEAG